MTEPYYADDSVTLYHGDSLDVLRDLPDASVDAVVTDPPYGLGFMGKEWDSGKSFVERKPAKRNTFDHVGGNHNPTSSADASRTRRVEAVKFGAWCEQWATECLRVLKPGGHMLAFGGSRTWHRLAAAVEDAGFEIRDSIAWLYGQGFAKSHNLDNLKSSPFCRCSLGESKHDGDLLGVRLGVSAPSESRSEGEVSDLLTTVQREGAGPELGDLRSPGTNGAEDVHAADGPSEPCLEGRRDAQAGQGQLQGRSVRALSGGVPSDGPRGRLHHGAPAGHGPMDRALPVADGSGEPQGPQSVQQCPGEPGAVPVERGSQAWRGWPVCERCAQPVIPAGLGTALKPAFEPVVVGRKPLAGTVASTVLEYGTGALNIDGCRVGDGGQLKWATPRGMGSENSFADDAWTQAQGRPHAEATASTVGRWPTNVVLDESQAAALDQQTGVLTSGANPTRRGSDKSREAYGDFKGQEECTPARGAESGGASRFYPVFDHRDEDPENECPDCQWELEQLAEPETKPLPTFRYEAKAPTSERPRDGQTAHPTVKPLDLMRWLVRLVTPPGGTVLEPFAGSGTTAEACVIEGFQCIAIEREAAYLPLIVARLAKPIQIGLDFEGGAA